MGCDFGSIFATFGKFVSIHAPTLGATGVSEPPTGVVGVSIHAPT